MSWLALAHWLTYLGLSLLLGGGVMRRLRLSAPPLWWSSLGAGLLLLGAVVGVGSTLLTLGFTAPGDVADFLMTTRAGEAAILRLIGAALLLAAELQGRQVIWSNLIFFAGAAAALFGVAYDGHAGEKGGVSTALDLLHAGAAAIWVGGVLALALDSWRRRSPTPELTGKFTRLALSCLGVLLLSGVAATLSHVPLDSVWPAMLGSTWGLALLFKLEFLALALLAALLVRRALHARRKAPLWIEGLLLLGVLGMSGALSTQPPPTLAVIQPQRRVVSFKLGQQQLSGQLVLSGPGDLDLRLVPAIAGVEARLIMTDHPMPDQRLELQADDGELRAQTRLWMSGNWVLELSKGHQRARVPFQY